MRRREIEQAKLAIAREEAELSKLKDEEKILKGLVQQLKGIFFLFSSSARRMIPIRGEDSDLIFFSSRAQGTDR